MFNPRQFKQKKKRAVDPNAPPRPNLMSHEKKLKETHVTLERLVDIIDRQQDQIQTLSVKYQSMQSSIEQLLNYIKNQGRK